jgi:hypothetical protein
VRDLLGSKGSDMGRSVAHLLNSVEGAIPSPPAP